MKHKDRKRVRHWLSEEVKVSRGMSEKKDVERNAKKKNQPQLLFAY